MNMKRIEMLAFSALSVCHRLGVALHTPMVTKTKAKQNLATER